MMSKAAILCFCVAAGCLVGVGATGVQKRTGMPYHHPDDAAVAPSLQRVLLILMPLSALAGVILTLV
jgi:hypothetical protein